MIEAVIFDMDGVLINSEPLWREAEIAGFATVGLDFDDAMCKRTMGKRLPEVVAFWRRELGWNGATDEEMTRLIFANVKALIQAKGVAMPGVMEALELVQSLGLKCAIASSSDQELIDTVVDQLNIGHFFDLTRSAQYETYGKPHPAVFIETGKALGVPPERCLVIEDSLNGVIAGRAAGMKVIVVPDEEDMHDPQMAIAHKKLNSLTQFTNEIIQEL